MLNRSILGRFLGALTLALIVIAGCSAPADLDAEQIAKDSLLASFDIKQQTSTVAIDGDFNLVDPEKGESNGEFNLALDGYFAETEEMQPLVDMMIDGGFKLMEAESEIAGEVKLGLKLTEDSVYFNLMSFPEALLGEQAGLLTVFANQWWQMKFPEELVPGIVPNIDPEYEQRMREKLESASLFKDVELMGEEKVNGENSYHLKATLDKDGVITYLEEVGELSDQAIEPDQRDDVERVLSLLADASAVEFWVTKADKYMTRAKFDFDLNLADVADYFEAPTEGADLGEGQIRFSLTADAFDFNKAQEIEIPENVKEFDLGALGLGAPAFDPAAGADLEGFGGLPQ